MHSLAKATGGDVAIGIHQKGNDGLDILPWLNLLTSNNPEAPSDI